MRRTAVMLGFARAEEVERYRAAAAATGTLDLRVIYPFLHLTAQELEHALDGADALLLPGGFGVLSLVEPTARVSEVNWLRDRLELALLQRATRSGQRVLAVCRGMELVTVAYGGRLDRMSAPHRETWTEVSVAPGSALSRCVPAGTARVYCNHRTHVTGMPPGFAATARDGLGQIEAMEAEELPILATQFHPERSDLLGVYRWLAL